MQSTRCEQGWGQTLANHLIEHCGTVCHFALLPISDRTPLVTELLAVRVFTMLPVEPGGPWRIDSPLLNVDLVLRTRWTAWLSASSCDLPHSAE